MAEQWYYAYAGKEHGPVARGELQTLLATGILSDEALVRGAGMLEWLPAWKVFRADMVTVESGVPEAAVDGSLAALDNNPYAPPRSAGLGAPASKAAGARVRVGLWARVAGWLGGGRG